MDITTAILNDTDDSFVMVDSGNLAGMIEEAHGWTQDCGRTYGTLKGALDYIEHTYEGGLAAFSLANSML